MSRNAAALLLLVLAAGGCGSPPTEPVAESDASRAPASAPADPSIAVPGDFPLTEGMPPNESGEEIVVAGARGVGMRMLDFCGTRPLRGLELADRATAASSGPEHSSTRDLMVFADPQRASAVAARVLDAAHACPVEESGPDSELFTEVRASDAGPGAATVVHTYATGGRVAVGAEIIEVVPVGTALLVTSSYAEWSPGPVLDDGITQGRQALAPVLEAMQAFGPATVAPTAGAEAPVIGPDGVGGFALGMAALEAESAGGIFEDNHGVGCVTFTRQLPSSGDRVVGEMSRRGVVASLAVERGRTPEGAGPGTTLRSLERLYGDEGLASSGGTDRVVTVPHADRRYRFTLAGRTVASVTLELLDHRC